MGTAVPQNAPGADGQITVAMVREEKTRLRIMQDDPVDLVSERKKRAFRSQLICATCTLQADCPEFGPKKGLPETSVCAYNEAFESFPVRNAESVIELMTEVVDNNKRRYRMAIHQETVASGGMADPNVTRLGDTVFEQAQQLLSLDREMGKVTMSVTGSVATLTGQTEQRGPGILTQLFAPRLTEVNQLPMTVSEAEKGMIIEVENKADGQKGTPPPSTTLVPGNDGTPATEILQEEGSEVVPNATEVNGSPREWVQEAVPGDGGRSEVVEAEQTSV